MPATTKIYIPFEESCGTPSGLKAVMPMLTSCKFHTLFSHIHTQWIEDAEWDKATIVKKDEQSGGKLNAPLQINSVYVLCPFVESELNGTAFLKTLRMRRGDSTSYRVNTQWEQEREVKSFPSLGIHKSITFIDEGSDKEIGWYNRHANVLWISDVTHHPESVKVLFDKILKAIRQLQVTGKVTNIVDFTIGADPEFEVVNKDGTIFNASSIFRDRDVGHDGHAETGEIRPEPANRPLKLVRNVKRLMWKVGLHPDLPDDAKIFAGGGTKTNTGGHIHFGLPRLSPQLQDLLFDMVAEPTQKYQGELRNGCSGFRKTGGDTCRQADCHSGVEWRPLPSWIVSEDIASAVVTTTYAIVKSFYVKPITKPITKETYRSLHFYPIYKDYIERFIKLFIDGEVGELSGKDVRSGWSMKRRKPQFNVKISSQTDWIRRFFKPINCKQLRKSVRVAIDFGGYNELMVGTAKELPHDLLSKFEEFSDSHFITTQWIQPASLDRSYRQHDLVIFLPNNWMKTRRTKDLFVALRGMIQEAIIEVGAKGGRS